MVWITLLAAAFVIKYELPRLSKHKLWKELWLFSALLTFALLLNIAQSLHMSLPNPLDLILIIYKPISKILMSFLG